MAITEVEEKFYQELFSHTIYNTPDDQCRRET